MRGKPPREAPLARWYIAVVRVWIWFAVLAACRGVPAMAPAMTSSEAPGSLVASNLLRGDYAGSRACADCHGAIYSAWEASAMRGMTRDARTAAIRAPFDGASLRVGGDTVTMVMRGGERVMQVVTAQRTETFRVTKVIGGRYREDFVGVDQRGEDPARAQVKSMCCLRPSCSRPGRGGTRATR
jgi:hypothetical protein